MKKTFILLAMCAFIAACSGSAGSGKDPGQADIQQDQSVMEKEPGNLSKAASLIAQSDCLTCHKEQENLIGPAFATIAAKYSPTGANVDSLAHKIIKGGSGAWGEIPMTPHPNISVPDAREMAQYILSIETKS